MSDGAWREQALLICATLGLLVFMVRVLAAGWPGRFTIFFPDSFSFINVAKHTPFSFQFYADERPIAYPTLLFLLGRSTVVTVVVQTFLYGLGFLFVAATACRVLRSTLASVISAFLVISVAIQPRFALWNTHILSESLGMTLAAFSIGAWWRFANDPSTRRLHWAGIATVGWITVRDSNVPPWLVVGVPALLLASFLWRSAAPSLRKALRVWGIVTLVVCVGVSLAQSANGRNRYATMNNIGLRVLPDEQLTKWFEDQGMPLDQALRIRTGVSSFDNGWDMLTSPDLEKFRKWADSDGQAVMLLSYVRFAPHWLAKLNDDLPVLLASDQSAYDAFGVAGRLPSAMPLQLGGPNTTTGLVVWTMLAVVGLALAALRARSRQSIVIGLLLISSFIDVYMAYVGDSVEVQRHMVGPLSRMSLLLVISFGLGLDALIDFSRPRRTLVEAERIDESADADDADSELVVTS